MLESVLKICCRFIMSFQDSFQRFYKYAISGLVGHASTHASALTHMHVRMHVCGHTQNQIWRQVGTLGSVTTVVMGIICLFESWLNSLISLISLIHI